MQLVAEALKSIFTGDFTKLDEMTKKWGLFGDIVSALAHSLGFVIDTLSLENVGGAFGNLVGDVKTKGIGGAMTEQWDLFKGELTDIKNNIGSWFAGRSAPEASP